MKRGCDENVFRTAIAVLAETGALPKGYRPHSLKGKYKGCMECHLAPDWLLVWRQSDEELILILTDIGTHQDIFGW